jgi:hypothetical protein
MNCNKCGQPLVAEEQFCGNCGAPRPAGDARFQNAEEQYYLLKGQFAARRITREQLEAALKQLLFQDSQGRYWTIGSDTGKWYVHDGKTWVEANAPITSKLLVSELYTPQPQPSRGFNVILWLGVLSILIICLLGVLGIVFASSQGFVKISFGQPTNTPFPVFAPVISTVPVILPTLIAPTVLPTASPIVLGMTPTSMPTIATLEPTPSVMVATQIPTAIPIATPIPSTPTPQIPPGIYVTGIRIEPPIPNPGEDTFFNVTFLNTGAGTATYRWLVYVFKPDNTKNSFGETSKVLTSIPVGSGEQRVGTWKVTRGACGTYLARVAWIDDGNRATFFNKPDGLVFEFSFNMCQ